MLALLGVRVERMWPMNARFGIFVKREITAKKSDRPCQQRRVVPHNETVKGGREAHTREYPRERTTVRVACKPGRC